MGEFDRYEPISDTSITSKACPWCGEDLDPGDEVITIDGRTGNAAALSDPDFNGWIGIRLYHPRCRRKRELFKRAANNRRLAEFEGEGS